MSETPSDKSGQWNDDQTARIDKWLQEKWGLPGPKCSQCATTDWRLANPGILTLCDTKGNMLLGTGFPAIVMICANCGNMVLVNAVMAGIIEGMKGAKDG